jgi:mono/diheme cytochrome c family protein
MDGTMRHLIFPTIVVGALGLGLAGAAYSGTSQEQNDARDRATQPSTTDTGTQAEPGRTANQAGSSGGAQPQGSPSQGNSSAPASSNSAGASGQGNASQGNAGQDAGDAQAAAAPSSSSGGSKPFDVKAQFRGVCGFCHEDYGRHAGKGPQLMNSERSDEFIFNRIKNGMPGRMAAFGSVYTDDQIRQIVKFIRTLKAGEEPKNPA